MIKQQIKNEIKKYKSRKITIANLIENLEENKIILDRTDYKNFKEKLKEIITDYNREQIKENKEITLYQYNFDAIEDNGMTEDEELIEIYSSVNFEFKESYYIEVELIEEEDKYKEDLECLLEDVKKDVSTLPVFLAKVDNNKYAITKNFKEIILSELPKVIEKYNKTNEIKYIYRKLFDSDIVFYEHKDNKCLTNYYLTWEIIDM